MLSRECGVMLDRVFYQRVLEELRGWGQDQEALSVVAELLRRTDNKLGVEGAATEKAPPTSAEIDAAGNSFPLLGTGSRRSVNPLPYYG